MFSVVITTHPARFRTIVQVVEAWLKIKEVDDIILAVGGLAENLLEAIPESVKIHSYDPDPGNKIRFASGKLALNDAIILADDDVIPKPGLIDDYMEARAKAPVRDIPFFGILGKKFDDPKYLKCTHYRADKIDRVQEVGFVGVMYFIDSCKLNFTMYNLDHVAIDDLYWQLIEFPDTKKYVFPTKNYEDLWPTCNDETAIFKNMDNRKVRQDFYSKYGYKGGSK